MSTPAEQSSEPTVFIRPGQRMSFADYAELMRARGSCAGHFQNTISACMRAGLAGGLGLGIAGTLAAFRRGVRNPKLLAGTLITTSAGVTGAFSVIGLMIATYDCLTLDVRAAPKSEPTSGT